MIKKIICIALISFGLTNAAVVPKLDPWPTICVALHCVFETGACVADSECYAILDCLQVRKIL